MKAGDTFLLAGADIHLWMVISDPTIDSQRVVMVNFTTWKPYHDQACIVNVGDHPWVAHRSCVNYPESRLAADAQLEALKARSLLLPRPPLSQELLRRIRDCVPRSRIKEACFHILVAQGTVDDE